MVETLTVYSDRMEEMCRSGFLNATDLADYLVRKGLPFRQAHETVGKIVQHCLQELVALENLPLETLRRFSPLFAKDVSAALQMNNVINSRRVPGGTARVNVLREIKKAKKELAAS
jgi:argininosuccinate lyase